MKCTNPSCGSDSTRRVSLVYAEGSGTASTSSTTHGLVNVGNEIASVSASTSGTQRYESGLASRCAPPPKPSFAWFTFLVPVILLGGGVFGAPHVIDAVTNGAASRYFGGGDTTAFKVYFALLVAALLVGIFLGGRSALRRFNVENAVYEQAAMKWDRSWICMKCGHIYEA